jgi:cytochrome c-type biogenesis protein CcmE
VVAEGHIKDSQHFEAKTILAKHDETYMPKDVEEALKKTGHWNPNAGPPPPASTWNALEPRQKKG